MSWLMWNWPRFPSTQERERPRFVSGSEFEALQKIAEKGGRIDYRALAAEMGFGSHYMSVILRTLGNEDFIDFKASGMCILTRKGRELLRKRGLLSEEKAKEIEMKEVFAKNPWVVESIEKESKEGRKSKGKRKPIKHAEELFARKTEDLFAQKTPEEAKGLLARKEPEISEEALLLAGLGELELKTLKALAEVGGHIAGRNLASKMGYSYDYLDSVYRRLGYADYIDYRQSGIVHLLPKGRELLRKIGYPT